MSKGDATKDKLVAATAELLQRQGYHATGLREIVEESHAPRGSLYYHFPGGKDELTCAALATSGAAWRARIDAVVADAPDLGAAVEAVCKLLADDLAASDFERGCPVAAVALENPSKVVRAEVASHYRAWLGAIAERAGSKELAMFALASIEGALLLAKALHSKEPVLVVGRMLGALAARDRRIHDGTAERRSEATERRNRNRE